MSEDKNRALNEQEAAVLLDHDYDGIKEFDYPLPDWWVFSFVATVIFGIPYMCYYFLWNGPKQQEELANKLAPLLEVRRAASLRGKDFDEQTYKAIAAADGVEKGKIVFETNCLSCHEEGGKGDIGPNLTDAYWIHAKGTPNTIYQIVYNGYEENGMPPWKEELSKEEILQVVSYVMTLVNTNVVGGKEPQGELVE